MQNSIFEVEHPYIPPANFRSRLGEIVWNTFASDELAGWKDGEIVRPLPSDSQAPLLFDFPSTNQSFSPGDWVVSLISAIDQALPDVDILLNCLEIDSLTIRPYAPAFRLPSSPSTEAAAHCLIVARILIACREELIPPAFMTTEYTLGCLETVSQLAIMLGGEEAFLHAMSVIQDGGTYHVTKIDSVQEHVDA